MTGLARICIEFLLDNCPGRRIAPERRIGTPPRDGGAPSASMQSYYGRRKARCEGLYSWRPGVAVLSRTTQAGMIRPGLFWLVALLVLGAVISCAIAERHPDGSTTYSYRCEGADQLIVVTVNGDRGYLFSRQASQAIQRQSGSPAFAGDDVYYLPDHPADLAPGQAAAITIKGVELANCKNNPRAAVWEGARLRGVSYRAIGQEPPWLLEIHREKGFLLVTRYGETRQQFPYTEALSDPVQRTTRYTSEANGDSIVIAIKGESCRDSMSGEAFSSQVEISWRTQTLRGCGRALH